MRPGPGTVFDVTGVPKLGIRLLNHFDECVLRHTLRVPRNRSFVKPNDQDRGDFGTSHECHRRRRSDHCCPKREIAEAYRCDNIASDFKDDAQLRPTVFQWMTAVTTEIATSRARALAHPLDSAWPPSVSSAYPATQ